ncbi:MAG: TolC family protein [Bacilli bacterium]
MIKQNVVDSLNSHDKKISKELQEDIKTFKKIKLPPISVFLNSVYKHPSIAIFKATRTQEKEKLKKLKQAWFDYFSLSAHYGYGNSRSYGTTESEYVQNIESSSNKALVNYSFNVNFGMSIGDIFSNKHDKRIQEASIRTIEYNYNMAIENRKLIILKAYNDIVKQMASLNSISETAVLYSAQIKLIEKDFVEGKLSFSELSRQRNFGTGALVTYQNARIDLYNSISLLEVLSGIKIIND